MTQKRKVGPGGGDFALNPNRFSGGGGGGGRSGASVVKKARKKTAKPETSMKTKRKSTRTRGQMDRLEAKLERAQYKKNLEHSGYRYKNREDLKKGPDGRVRINIEGKGGLRKEVRDFRRTLDRKDEADTKAVKAYRFLQKSKHSQLKKGDEGYRESNIETKVLQNKTREALRYNNFKDNNPNTKDPTVRKVIRHNKRTVKEQFKKQTKKDRAERKAGEAKRRRD